MTTCDSEFTIFEKDTSAAPKCEDAWKKKASGGYVCFVDVYSNTTGRLRYRVPGGSTRYINVTTEHTYSYTYNNYKYTIEIIVIFYGFAGSKAIKVKTCYESTATPTPTPIPKGSLAITTSPIGATVRIDGQTWWQTTNCTITNLSVGAHNVEIIKPGYDSDYSLPIIEANKTTTYSVILTPTAATTGNISCISNPSGANVQIDGNFFWKKTNCVVPDVSPGKHNVVFTKEGYQTYAREVVIVAGDTKTVSATLIELHDEASIKCTCNVEATVTIDDKFPHTTPYTYTGLTDNKMYQIKFSKANYSTSSIFKIAHVGSAAHANLTYMPTFGFDINVNISGLSPSQGKTLYVLEVMKIPGTDTWYSPPLQPQIKWYNVSNKPYSARKTAQSCIPQPDFHSGFRENQDYAIFVGSSTLSFYPDKLVHKSTKPPTNVSLTDSYYDWLSSRACSFLGVSTNNCGQWFGALAVDILSPFADLYVIVNNRSLYTNEPESPTTLTYFCAALGCIPGGGVIKHAGKIKYTDELAELAAIAKKNPTLQSTLVNNNFFSKFDSLSNTDIKSILQAAKDKNWYQITQRLSGKQFKMSYVTLNNILLNLAEITGDPASYRIMARAMGISEDGLKSLRMIKGASTGQLQLTTGHADDVIHLAGHVPKEFKKVIDNVTELELNGTIVKAKQSQHTPLKVMGSMMDDVKLVTKEFNTAPYETVESCMEKLGKSAEKVKNYPNGNTLYEDVVDGAVQSVKKMEPILEEGMKVDSVSELNKIITETANNVPSSWRSLASTKLKSMVFKVTNWARGHPKWPLSKGMTLWYVMDNIPFYVYMIAIMLGIGPGAATWIGKAKRDNIKAIYFNVKTALDNESWTLFCSNLQMMIDEVDEFEEWTKSTHGQLSLQKMLDTFEDTIRTDRATIELFNEAHACGLPTSFTATIDGLVDGDTIYIKYNNTRILCRLVGINCPEKKGYTYSCDGTKQDFLVRRLTIPGGACVHETTWHANQLLYDAGKSQIASALPLYSTVTIKLDKAYETDKYGRKLVEIHRSGSNVNRAMLRSGLAVVFFYDNNSVVNKSSYLSDELQAKNAKTGVWKLAEGTGTIQCNSGDKTACKIWLDGIDTGEQTVSSAYTLTNVALGSHNVKFTKIVSGKDYACNVDVTVYKDQTAQASCTLTTEDPAENTGTIYCNSGDVTACEIWMDGVYTGHKTESSVYLLKDVPIGSHSIKFKKRINNINYECSVTTYVFKNEQANAECSLDVPGTCPKPSASYTHTPTTPKVNELIYLNASESSGDTNASIVKYEWYLDNQLKHTGMILTISFSTVAYHIVKLVVTNSCNETDSKTKWINIVKEDPGSCPNPTASYVISPSSPKQGETITLNGLDSTGGSGHYVSNYKWILDQANIGSGVFLSFTTSKGPHTLTLEITNDCLSKDTHTKQFNVGDPIVPPDKVGTIYCQSLNMTACTIWLDDVYTGKNTSSYVYLLKDVPIGSHKISFKKTKDGFNYVCSKTITVYENQQATAACTLQRIIEFPVYFFSNPSGAEISKQ